MFNREISKELKFRLTQSNPEAFDRLKATQSQKKKSLTLVDKVKHWLSLVGIHLG